MADISRELETLLACENVGPLVWQPPAGISKRLDGGRRGSAPDGFSIHSWGNQNGGGSHPKLTERALTFSEALEVAAVIDGLGTTPRDRSPHGHLTAVAWVRAIVVAIPNAYEPAIEQAARRLAMLRESRAAAEGFAAAMLQLGVTPSDDGDVPF